VIYIPIYPIFIFLCLRAPHFFFAASIKIKNGEFLGESKKRFTIGPSAFQPETIFFEGTDLLQLRTIGR
jgi:hypothetical protein